ncbi:MAG TPA: hypothetical protein VJ772_07975 [Nitrososphaeraceae archaeon]|nr:hypothetical protein [Nitrososphaeraceae archaeon]
MRIPNKVEDDFAKKLNESFVEIEDFYLQSMKPSLTTTDVNVMLQDGSVTQSVTFDPQSVMRFYRSFLKELKKWDIGEIQETTGELNRIYCQISANLDDYVIKGYFGIQYHILPYYKPDKQVIQLQKELIDLATNSSSQLESVANLGNNTIKQELKNMALDDLEFEDLFEKLLDNQDLIGKLEHKIKKIEKSYPELEGAEKKRNSLFYELENLIIKVYQVSPILIDYNKLMQGEEGIVVYFDIEPNVDAKAKKSSSKTVDFSRMKPPTRKKIGELFKEISSALRNKR